MPNAPLHLQVTDESEVVFVPRTAVTRCVLYMNTVEGKVYLYLSPQAEATLRKELSNATHPR